MNWPPVSVVVRQLHWRTARSHEVSSVQTARLSWQLSWQHSDRLMQACSPSATCPAYMCVLSLTASALMSGPTPNYLYVQNRNLANVSMAIGKVVRHYDSMWQNALKHQSHKMTNYHMRHGVQWTRGVYSIEAWTQPASLKKTRGERKSCIFSWKLGGEEKLRGKKD